MSGVESSSVQSAVAAVSQGMSVLQAAKQFQCAASSIHRALRRRGIEHKPMTLTPQSIHAAELQRQGLTATQAAEQAGVSLSAAYRASHRATQLRDHPRLTQTETTPLLRFIRALNEVPERLETFVASLELIGGKATSGMYLYQLAGSAKPNPTLRLAAAIVHQSCVFAPKLRIPPLSFEDLLIGKKSQASASDAKSSDAKNSEA